MACYLASPSGDHVSLKDLCFVAVLLPICVLLHT